MSWRRRRVVLFSVLAVVAGVCFWAVLHVGQWLVVQDPLEQAYAIVVLSGRMPDRAIEAARIYRENVAANVWVSQPFSPSQQLADMHISFAGEDFYNQKVLMSLGVPSDAIRIFPEPAANTEQEVDEIARLCRSSGARAVIVVTSKPHTRRVRLIWNRRVGDAPRLIVRYVSDDTFDAAHWWRVTQDALDVVREVLGIANAWAGFPVRPPPRIAENGSNELKR